MAKNGFDDFSDSLAAELLADPHFHQHIRGRGGPSAPMVRLNKVGSRLFGGLMFVIIGVIFTIFIAGDALDAVNSEGWSKAQGEVITSELLQTVSRDEDGGSTYTYQPAVTYTYTVDGIGHTGSRISFGDYSSNSEDRMRAAISPYPLGANITVYHHPADASNSVLEPGMSGSLWVMVASACIMPLIGIGLIGGAVRRMLRTDL